MSAIRFNTVDAFTDRPFAGNPAAVCVLDEPLPDGTMQLIAKEMNLSETAFVLPEDGNGLRHLRWFTPTTEVPLCGHATLATAHVLFEAGEVMPLRFRTLSGELVVHSEEGRRLRMDFPSDPPKTVAAPAGLVEALGVEPVSVLQGLKGWVVRLENEAAVRAVDPDYRALQRIELGELAVVMSITAPSDEEGIDFASRVFAPWAGVDEDPVTGVAHTSLTPYWCSELGRDTLEARQISERGGRLTVRNEDDRVHLIGHAVTMSEGLLRTA